MNKLRLVCIGNGMVGQRFLEQLTSRVASEGLDMTVFCEEPRAAYDRVQLTSFFAGKSAIDLNVVPARFFEDQAITLRLNDRVLSIDRARKTVRSARYRDVPYDKLLLATGSYPFVPPIPGRDRRGCFVYRAIEDLEAIRAAAKRARTGVVIGGGLLGLEAAKALHDLGLETHVVEFAPRLMAVQLDEAGGQLLRRKIEALGVVVHTSKSTKEIVDGSDHTHKMVFVDGTTLETDLIVYSAGIRPHDELAREAKLAVGERGGIAIDEHCRTSDPDIYAVGECALWNGRIYGLVAPGYQMAEVAARHIAGDTEARFTGADMSTKLKLMGIDVASVGDGLGKTPGALDYVYTDPVKGIYKKLVVSGDGKSLLGSVLVGDANDYGSLLQMTLNSIPLPDHPEDLILPAREGGAAKGLGVDLLPAGALICSCNSVTKGGICDAIAAGHTSIGALKKETKASSTCGGCGPLLKQILDAELKKQGVDVKNHLCEHFPYSRQELFHLTRVGEFKTFDEIIAKHGQGRGCDICKPAVASILAACWNEYILKPKHAPLQDTNDHYLANLQKKRHVLDRAACGGW
jgi:nitrite reductase (NADH) large subunit